MTDNYSLSDIAAVTDGNRNNGMFGNDWVWVIILLLFGWGRNGFGGGYGGSCGAPCATQADVRSAVDQQTLKRHRQCDLYARLSGRTARQRYPVTAR